MVLQLWMPPSKIILKDSKPNTFKHYTRIELVSSGWKPEIIAFRPIVQNVRYGI